MFKKSLYVKIVFIFISVVIISLITSYLVTSFFFHSEMIFDEEVAHVTTGVAELIERSGPENIPELIETLQTYYFDILIVNEDGVPFIETTFPTDVPTEAIESLFQTVGQNPTILPYGKREATRVVGMPIEILGETYAMFVHLSYEEELSGFKRVIHFALFLVLLIGSLLIVFSSRYLVNPIKKLTDAAKEMAKGNFSVRLKSKNKDEVGELITSFNHMATEVEKIDKMREDFVSSVSHEIQSPLTSIRGFTKAIRDEVVPKQHQKEYLDIIYQETERLSRLSENLLRLASLDSEHHPYHPETYRLDEQIRRTVLATEPQWKQKNLQISLELESVEVYADQDLLEQVWLNLLTNAIKYSHQNESIRIEVEKGKNIKVSIKDTGKGIPAESIPYLFDRFYKVDKARSNKVSGNGLGLSIVEKILMIHKFSIDVESEEGKGSIFTVTIPNEDERKKTSE
ncbi:two-component sensor histidine kinase [Halalkalibacter wakoensis JCM 9140]|uniref:Heme sensor protein HssS n=1 Tax=Halalkalibacter wakoensis JCM 9140 TaxID=1236970 RepID=W4PYS9_9BACI|nr:HAMP domain-containing sensor histidine kinase [Halalkalibacter wakoensis]GAE24638.1 two-component sensor histidine kinase [Halalkalibacter wakoensis JCM 9140]